MFVDPATVEAFVGHKWKIIQRDSREVFLRCFGEHFGVHPMMVAYLFNRVENDIPEAGVSLEDILWTLLFLKQNPTGHVGARFCRCSRTTYREHVWYTTEVISCLNVVRTANVTYY